MVFLENGEGFGGDDFGVGVEEEVLHPTHIAVAADYLAAVAEGVGRAGSVLLGLRSPEETHSFIFEVGHELQWDAMVDELEEAELLGGSDYEGLGLRVGEVDLWDSIEGARDGRGGCMLACVDE